MCEKGKRESRPSLAPGLFELPCLALPILRTRLLLLPPFFTPSPPPPPHKPLAPTLSHRRSCKSMLPIHGIRLVWLGSSASRHESCVTFPRVPLHSSALGYEIKHARVNPSMYFFADLYLTKFWLSLLTLLCRISPVTCFFFCSSSSLPSPSLLFVLPPHHCFFFFFLLEPSLAVLCVACLCGLRLPYSYLTNNQYWAP